MQDELLPTKAVSGLLGVTVTTINRWVKEGKLVPAVDMPGETGARLYRRSDIDAVLAARQPTEAAS